MRLSSNETLKYERKVLDNHHSKYMPHLELGCFKVQKVSKNFSLIIIFFLDKFIQVIFQRLIIYRHTLKARIFGITKKNPKMFTVLCSYACCSEIILQVIKPIKNIYININNKDLNIDFMWARSKWFFKSTLDFGFFALRKWFNIRLVIAHQARNMPLNGI